MHLMLMCGFLFNTMLIIQGRPQFPDGFGDTIAQLGGTISELIRNGDPSKVLKGSSTLIEGLSGSDSNNSTGGIGEIATNLLVGTTRVGGEILENQPDVAETGKTVTADVVSIGSQLVAEVSKQPQILEGANEIKNALQNAFQGLFG